MKLKHLFPVILGVGLLLVGCSDKENIEPSGEYTPLRYEFPQGDEEWDNYFEEVYENYGICFIYKGYTNADFDKTWTISSSGASSGWTGNVVTSERMPLYVDFLSKHLIPFLGNKEITEVCLPLYIYLSDDLASSSPMFYGHSFKLDGIDYWGLGLLKDMKPVWECSDFRKDIMTILYSTIVKNAIVKKHILAPDGFASLVDYNAPVDVKDNTSPDYYLKRGFVGLISLNVFSAEVNWADINNGIWSGDLPQIQNTDGGDFLMFAYTAMRYSEKAFKEKYDPVKYPIVSQRYQLVVEQFKKYGFDLQAFASSAETLMRQ